MIFMALLHASHAGPVEASCLLPAVINYLMCCGMKLVWSLSQNETQTEPVLLAIERQRLNMPERGRMRKHSSHVHSLDSPTGGAAPATPGSSESSPHPSKRVIPPTPSSSASRQISEDDAPLVSPRNSSPRC